MIQDKMTFDQAVHALEQWRAGAEIFPMARALGVPRVSLTQVFRGAMWPEVRAFADAKAMRILPLPYVDARRPVPRINRHQRRWLEMIHAASVRLGHPPAPREVDPDGYDMVGTLRELGLVALSAPASTDLPRRVTPVRLTPAARVVLGLPLIAYIAWPITGDPDIDQRRGHRWIEWCARWLRVTPVAPFMFGDVLGLDVAMDHGAAAAARADVCIVVDDPMLFGRVDVAASIPAMTMQAFIRTADQPDIEAGRAWPWPVYLTRLVAPPTTPA